ncbi:NADPH-dependent ferric siderophore reductase [Methylovirgula ligni]|uniref:NADPH-dependent ferric siderophore reductase n=1 Tax=Methylovirgula ligni TaxID=569860 RepID=A0A3D9Z4H3_9HYPH|nr:siderophore-interacting protein [Methylovirgula ligni]QAY95541.1 NADPH-dependent ferric siderophore reductase [Methylovirgula ligni]REF89120.1 NADPH-dependent ferric siderophore reductase [Methylovirgula ligni]
MEHQIIRHRLEPRHRSLTVKEKTRITPGMIRILFAGSDLEDFVSLAPDDHVKLFIPTQTGEVERRDYTPRRFDRAARTLAIDFAVHDAGPATRWAIGAALGDRLDIGGPRGSAVVSPTFDWWLMIGDETALPAIGRRIEEMPDGTRVVSIVSVRAKVEEQTFATGARHEALWVHRPLDHADDPASLLSTLQTISLPDGDGFVWIAAEARVARALRDYVVKSCGHPLAWTKAAGYWRKGVADATTSWKIECSTQAEAIFWASSSTVSQHR